MNERLDYHFTASKFKNEIDPNKINLIFRLILSRFGV